MTEPQIMYSSQIIIKVYGSDHHLLLHRKLGVTGGIHTAFTRLIAELSIGLQWRIQNKCLYFVYTSVPWKAILFPLTLSFSIWRILIFTHSLFFMEFSKHRNILFISQLLSSVFLPEWSIKDLAVFLWTSSKPLIDLTGLPSPISL